MRSHRKRPILGITYRNGLGYGYDFENHVIQAGSGITMVGACPERSRRDGDGNRVSKTVAGVTTKYLVDPQNPTGYVQVVQENYSGSTGANRELSHSFVYGLERISQLRSYLANNQNQTQTSYYVYDGHGSTRALTDPNGAVTDTYNFSNPRSTPGQKLAAMALLIAAIFGTARAFNYVGTQGKVPLPPIVNDEVPPLVKVPGTLSLEPGTVSDVDPNSLLLGRADLLQGKLDSIAANGPSETEPIIVSKNGVVWNGNHRVFLAAQAGVSSIKVVVMDVPIDGGYPINKVPIIGGN